MMKAIQVEPRADRVAFAVGVMVATNLTLATADAIIKSTLTDMPLSQFILLRSCITVPMLVLIMKGRFPQVSLRPVTPIWAVLRSALLLISLLLYYAALPRLNLSVAAAAYYTIPLFIALFSGLLIGETVGPKGWGAVALGFVGVLVMLRPDATQMNIYALMPLASAVLYALAMIVTRTKVRGENPFVLALTFNLLAVLLASVASLSSLGSASGLFTGPWIAMDVSLWLLLLLLTGTMTVGSVGTAIAYQSGPPATVSTWDFSYLAFAVLLGVVLFSEQLQVSALLGISLIAAGGIIAVRR